MQDWLYDRSNFFEVDIVVCWCLLRVSYFCNRSCVADSQVNHEWDVSNLATFWDTLKPKQFAPISGSPSGRISICPPSGTFPKSSWRWNSVGKPIQNVDCKASKILLTYLFYSTFRGEQLTRQSCKWVFEFNDQHLQVLPLGHSIDNLVDILDQIRLGSLGLCISQSETPVSFLVFTPLCSKSWL